MRAWNADGGARGEVAPCQPCLASLDLRLVTIAGEVHVPKLTYDAVSPGCACVEDVHM
jgi:hypothetical protein